MFENIYSFVFFHREKQMRLGPSHSIQSFPPTLKPSHVSSAGLNCIHRVQPRVLQEPPGPFHPFKAEPAWMLEVLHTRGWGLNFSFCSLHVGFPRLRRPREPLRPGGSGRARRHGEPGSSGGCPGGRRGKGRRGRRQIKLGGRAEGEQSPGRLRGAAPPPAPARAPRPGLRG